MPIHARYRWFYPIHWPQLSAVIRFKRAQGKCERGRPHGRVACHLGEWAFIWFSISIRVRVARRSSASRSASICSGAGWWMMVLYAL